MNEAAALAHCCVLRCTASRDRGAGGALRGLVGALAVWHWPGTGWTSSLLALPVTMHALVLLLVGVRLELASALDNGLGVSGPAMGW